MGIEQVRTLMVVVVVRGRMGVMESARVVVVVGVAVVVGVVIVIYTVPIIWVVVVVVGLAIHISNEGRVAVVLT